MVKETIINQYLNQGKRLIPATCGFKKGDKRGPSDRGWQKNHMVGQYTPEVLYAHPENICWWLGEEDIVLDADKRNGGLESLDKLRHDLGLPLKPTVETPRGGVHIYLKRPTQFLTPEYRTANGELKALKNDISSEYPGIDVLYCGLTCTIVGSINFEREYVWAEGSIGEFEQTECPEVLMSMLIKRPYQRKNVVKDTSSSSWSQEQIEEMLNSINPDVDYSTWLKVGMALHDWDVYRGLHLWESWSMGGSKYQEGATLEKWRSFKAGNGTTIGTILHLSKNVKKSSVISDVKEKIRNYDGVENIKTLLTPLKTIDLTSFDKESIANDIKERQKGLNNKVSIKTCREVIEEASVTDRTEELSWVDDWCYCVHSDTYVQISTGEDFKINGFNHENGHHVPPSEGGSRLSAAKYVANEGLIKTIHRKAYRPMIKERFFTEGGHDFFNTYDYKSSPKPDASYTPEGKEAIQRLQKHLKFIGNEDRIARILTEWLAHNVQKPGVKLTWAPFIQSIQGTGKSYFISLLQKCMGHEQVGMVQSTQVNSSFNQWAVDKAVNVLEELNVRGQNRHEAMNALKTLISDKQVQINPKGLNPYMTKNTCNYACFTNFKDALPLTEGDRRYFVIFNKLRDIKDMYKYVGEHSTEYFDKLFGDLDTQSGQLLKWLLEYPISKEFLDMKRAPDTKYKESMVTSEQALIEGYDEVKELLELGNDFYSEDIISTADLFRDLRDINPNLNLQTWKACKLLQKLGFHKYPKVVKYKEKTRTVWTRDVVTENKEVLDLFKQCNKPNKPSMPTNEEYDNLMETVSPSDINDDNFF